MPEVQVPLPDWALSVAPGANADFHSPSLRLTLSSPTHPESVYDYHHPSRQLQLVQPPAVPSHDPEKYYCTVQWATSADGTAVPITLAHAAGLRPDGSNPCLVVVYGAYGHCLPLEFYAERVPLLQVRLWHF
jgi:oligopeptidase B